MVGLDKRMAAWWDSDKGHAVAVVAIAVDSAVADLISQQLHPFVAPSYSPPTTPRKLQRS